MTEEEYRKEYKKLQGEYQDKINKLSYERYKDFLGKTFTNGEQGFNQAMIRIESVSISVVGVPTFIATFVSKERINDYELEKGYKEISNDEFESFLSSKELPL